MASTAPATPICRVGVFIDWQNCYRTARDAFDFRGSGVAGNVNPLLLAAGLTKARLSGQGEGRLTKVRIYTGRASQKRDTRTYAANRRQFQGWKNLAPDLVDVIVRTLDYSLGMPREKGIDVQLAIDLVRTSLFAPEHDVAVLVSADTDLLPAVELIAQTGSERIEVATWEGPYWAPAMLAVKGVEIRQHLLTEALYEKIKDETDYKPRPSTRPSAIGDDPPTKYPPGAYGRRLPPRETET
jgi:uncharacterized LabA/DUF88 family protein